MGLELVLLIGLLGAIACALAVTRVMRGRTSVSPSRRLDVALRASSRLVATEESETRAHGAQ